MVWVVFGFSLAVIAFGFDLTFGLVVGFGFLVGWGVAGLDLNALDTCLLLGFSGFVLLVIDSFGCLRLAGLGVQMIILMGLVFGVSVVDMR